MENTDNAIINTVNKVVLKGTGHNIDISRTDRSHRVGLTIHVKPRDIIVHFISYRDLVYLNKKNLKSYNNNPSNNNRVLRHVNEVLTRTRAKLFAETRRLHKEKFIAGCRTMDGRIKMKLFKNGNIVTITREDELYRQVPDSDTERVAIGLQTSRLNRR